MIYLSNFFPESDHCGLKVAIVGASGGIGSGLLSHLMGQENIEHLYACSRKNIDESVQRAKASEKHIEYLNLDILDESSIQQAVNAIKPQCDYLDAVIVATGKLHDAEGFQPEKSLKHLNGKNFTELMCINALGPALVAKYFLPVMNRQGPAFFGAVSARVGSISDNRLGGWHSYRSSKAALNMLIKNMAIEYQLRSPKLVIVGLHPGTVDTTLSKPFQGNVPDGKLFTPEFSASQLLQTIDQLKPEDSGKCFAWDEQAIPP